MPPTPTATTSSLHGLSVQLTEALAEYWHARVREEPGFPDRGGLTIAEILDQGYRGSRVLLRLSRLSAAGGPSHFGRAARAGPDRRRASLRGAAAAPQQSTDALVVHHPEASYFNAT